MHAKMNVIAKINCYLECSVVTLKLRKEDLNTVIYNTSVLLGIKKLNRLIYRTLLHVNIIRPPGVTNCQKQSVFWPTLDNYVSVHPFILSPVRTDCFPCKY